MRRKAEGRQWYGIVNLLVLRWSSGGKIGGTSIGRVKEGEGSFQESILLRRKRVGSGMLRGSGTKILSRKLHMLLGNTLRSSTTSDVAHLRERIW